MEASKKTARLAGALYLILAITGMFSIMYVPSLIVVDDPALTVKNIIESPNLYRAGIVSGLVCQTCFVFLAVVLYKLLRHVDATAALTMLVLVVVAVPISFINSLNEYAALILVQNKHYTSAFTPEQLHAQISVFRAFYYETINVLGIFWGLWLFPLGYLVYKSGMFPKMLGTLLMLGCFGYLIGFVVANFLPNFTQISIPGNIVATVAEFAFIFYLLHRGVRSTSPVVTIP